MVPRAFPALAVAALVFSLTANTARAQSVALADRIEEDWVLVVDGTASQGGPQVNTVMSPTADLSQPVVVLDVNYRHYPAYAAGGLQVLVYSQWGMGATRTVTTSPLNLANETVKWTQRMTLSGGTIQYVIPSVSSTTWGTFTSNDVLVSYTASLLSFSTYDPATSAASSGGAWKTTGLKSLTLVQVRYYAGNTLLLVDNTARPVDFTRPFTKP